MKSCTKKYLFYNCYVNSYYCVFVGRIYREYKHNLSFSMHITDGNIEGLCPSMYSRGEGNCSHPISLMETPMNTNRRSILEAKGTVPTSLIAIPTYTNHLCFPKVKRIVPTSLMVCVRRCFLEVKGTVHIPCQWCQLKSFELVVVYRWNYRWTTDGLRNPKRE